MKREMSKKKTKITESARAAAPRSRVADRLFTEVAGILEEARRRTVRSVNTHMVTAYWLVGWRIVEAEQGGRKRAGYGERLMENLSVRLTQRYGKGHSVANLRNCRAFYLTYPDRLGEIHYPLGSELPAPGEPGQIHYPLGSELPAPGEPGQIHYPVGSESRAGFDPNLSWSHYRALMRVEKPEARQFYEREAGLAGWSKRELERQIGSLYYERLLMSRDRRGMLAGNRKSIGMDHPLEVIKDPYVLEFLDLPEDHRLTETELEERIITHLQAFLLELGRGFAFIGRQQRLTLDGDHFYADLVFYQIRLKCYLIVDLKTGKLTHEDLGQMKLYVNYYDREVRVEGDNPTLGLILCTDKNDAVVRYVLDRDAEKIFASRYRVALPSEAELAAELRREVAALGSSKPSPAALPPAKAKRRDALRSKKTRKKRP
jgi:predicted nuclease of restriction endonuclease-like (RecB) superfamily